MLATVQAFSKFALQYSNPLRCFLYSTRDLLFGSIYDTFSGENNLSKAVFLEQLCVYIERGTVQELRTLVVKEFSGMRSLTRILQLKVQFIV